ncbi:MAG: PD-(D/E)XK nuclease family protein [Coleofasciculaceae cyanobacterium]
MPSPPHHLPRANAKQIREYGKQYYLDANGNKLPSVSTILNATKPQKDRERLFNWRQRVGTVEASKISGTASRRGTGTHKQIQRYLEGKNAVCPEHIMPYWQSIEPILQEISNVKLVEATVFNYDLKYAGIVDCVASFRGIPCICEWKTADKPKGSVERLYDYPLQIAAYLNAVNSYYQEYDIKLNHALLVVAIPEQQAEVFWFENEAMQTYSQQWKKRVTKFWNRF